MQEYTYEYEEEATAKNDIDFFLQHIQTPGIFTLPHLHSAIEILCFCPANFGLSLRNKLLWRRKVILF